MKKKLLAMLCVLSVLVGVFALSATTVTAAEEDVYYVGYAKIDINPYYDPLTDRRIMPVPLRGNGSPQSRLAYEARIDDNGSGAIDDMNASGVGGDGLFLTCIAISNSKSNYDNAVFLFTMDAIGDMGHTNLARKALKAELGIDADQVMVSGTHSHGSVDLSSLVKSLYKDTVADVAIVDANGQTQYIDGRTAHNYLSLWRERLVGYSKEVVIEGLDEDGTDHIKTYKDVYTNSNSYFVQAARAAMEDCTAATIRKGQIEVDQSSAASGKAMNYVRHYVRKDTVNNNYHYVMDTFSNDKVGGTFQGHVSNADQTLHTISFEFADGSKNPIVLINWRNHPQLDSTDYNRQVTSDYINAFRYAMEQKDYRAAFFQGTGGNTQPTSRISAENWLENLDRSAHVSRLMGNTYGKLLADVTLECLSKNMSEVAAGQVMTVQKIYTADRIDYSEAKYKAAVEAVAKGSYPFYYTDAETGEKVTISCDSQATKIVSHYETYQGGTTTIDLEIDTIMIGPEIAIVTCPGEPFDRYSLEAVQKITELRAEKNGVPVTYAEYNSIANQYNDWENLQKIPNAQFGEPLIFGYTNQHITYIPNALAYNYNAEHPELYSTNSYESFMTPLAEGGGEQMVANLGDMLNEMVNGVAGYCEVCGQDANWYALRDISMQAGHTHYYLTENLEINQTELTDGRTICLDLRGFELTSNKRLFTIADTTLNIFDSSTAKTGKGIGSAEQNTGGVFWVYAGGTLNIYGGTFSFDTTNGNPYYGGIIYNEGTVNMYGGKILGTDSSHMGGAVCLANSASKLNVYGGEITAGTAAKGGDCVASRYSDGVVSVAANAKVADIYHLKAPTASNFKIVDSPADSDAQTPFAGSVTLNANGITHGAVVGSVSVPWVKGAAVTVSSGYDVVMNKNNQLVAEESFVGAAGVVLNEEITGYDTLAQAIANVGEGYVILGADVRNLTISSDITVDLNGKKITYATASKGATLTLMDSKTADYFIGDQIYGSVKNTSGTVVAADHYMPIKETTGTSYHCYKMNLSEAVLRPGRCGMYYTSEFDGDAMVKAKVESFGTALRIGKAPDANSMNPGTYTALAPEAFSGESNSTVLVDIFKSANIVSTNRYNANLKVYASPYIKMTDGSYLFGDVNEEQAYSLKTLTEKVSKTYSVDVLKENAQLMEMYRRFSAAMSDWDIQNIRDAYAANQAVETEALKVLLVGNSHSLDSFHLLYDVIEAEGIPENNKYGAKSVELGVLYYGGCRMRKHAEHAKGDVAAYDLYRIGPSTNGQWVITPETTMKTGLLADKWDIVVFQEMNMEEGLFVDDATNIAVSSTQYVYNYIRQTLGYTPEFKWNMIWSNPTIPDCCDTTNYTTDAQYKTKWIYKLQTPAYGGFLDGYYSWENRAMAFYKNDPQEQYNKTVKYLQDHIIGHYGIANEEAVVAPGTTVMYALQNLTLSGSSYNYLANEQFSYRDYTHLSDVSRVMVSYLWYAELFGLDQIDSMAYTTVPAAMRAKDKTADVVLDTKMQSNIIEAVNYTLDNRFGMVK